MPVTPFHFGPGALLHAAAPRQVSFLAFCAANVFIDIESLYNLTHAREPVHGWLHTYAGATLAVAAVLMAFLAARWFAARLWLPNLLGWRGLSGLQVAAGAAAGAYSHILLDSFMHADIQPLAPFAPGNALLGCVPVGWLHLGCLALGGIGVLVLATRWFFEGGGKGRS